MFTQRERGSWFKSRLAHPLQFDWRIELSANVCRKRLKTSGPCACNARKILHGSESSSAKISHLRCLKAVLNRTNFCLQTVFANSFKWYCVLTAPTLVGSNPFNSWSNQFEGLTLVGESCLGNFSLTGLFLVLIGRTLSRRRFISGCDFLPPQKVGIRENALKVSSASLPKFDMSQATRTRIQRAFSDFPTKNLPFPC